MATGIQTGIRRGSRLAPSSPASPQTSRLQYLSQRWSALPRMAKGAIIASAIALQLGLAGAGAYSTQHSLVDLYPTQLQAHELPDISQALLAAQIEHQVTPQQDGIKLSKQERTKARALLASRNLPRHRVLTPGEITSDMTRTAIERKHLYQRLLEGEITQAMRSVEGVHDARVMLSIPEKTYFDDSDPTRAAVTVIMEPGRELGREGINGLINMVAFSVPCLTPENVRLIDSKGRDLTPANSNPTGGVSAAHFEIRSAEEKRLQDKVQVALERKLPGRTEVVVNLDLDFSEMEKRLYTPGSEQDDGQVAAAIQSITESYNNEGGRESSKDMESEKKSVNYKVREASVAFLSKLARIERISATVFADGLSEKEAQQLEKAVAHSLGVQEARGDSVYVDTGSWDHEMLSSAGGSHLSSNPVALDDADQALLSNSGILALLLAQTLLMGGAFAAYLLLTSRKRAGASVMGNVEDGLRTTGIIDHGFDKSGQIRPSSQTTGVQTTELLEGLVSQRPKQAADLLRSTWLAN